MRTTDMADELFRGPETELPAGVRLATAKRGGVTVTRVEIAREGLARPRGRYVTLEMPSVSVLDERDTDVIETGAAELRALLPPEGPVLVLGIGNRRVTAEDPGHHGAAAYPAGAGHPAGGGTGPRRVRGHRADPAAAGGGHGRRSAARSPDLCGQPLQCRGCPAGPHHPVFRHRPAPGGCPTRSASGCRSSGRIPTLMDADEGAVLVLTPRALDSVIAHGSALLAGILNRALQPRLSVAQLCWLTG